LSKGRRTQHMSNQLGDSLDTIYTERASCSPHVIGEDDELPLHSSALFFHLSSLDIQLVQRTRLNHCYSAMITTRLICGKD